jgi:hypothetical protein
MLDPAEREGANFRSIDSIGALHVGRFTEMIPLVFGYARDHSQGGAAHLFLCDSQPSSFPR